MQHRNIPVNRCTLVADSQPASSLPTKIDNSSQPVTALNQSTCAGTSRTYFGYNVGSKLGTYDESTCLETFLTKFRNCAQYFKCNEEDKLFQVLWAAADHTSVDQLTQLLRNRFGNESQTERYRAELRVRRRKPGERLQGLYIDIGRLMALAYPGPPSSLSELIARDAFLEALADQPMRVRILERIRKLWTKR